MDSGENSSNGLSLNSFEFSQSSVSIELKPKNQNQLRLLSTNDIDELY